MPKLLAKFEKKDLNSPKDIRYWLFIVFQRGFTHQNFSVRIQIMSLFLDLFPQHKEIFNDTDIIFDGFFLAFDRLLNEERDIQFKKRDDDEEEPDQNAPQKEMKVKEKVVGFIKFILEEFISRGEYAALLQHWNAKSPVLANFILQIQNENNISVNIGDAEILRLSNILQTASAQSLSITNLKQSIFKLLAKADLSKLSFNSLAKFLGGFSLPLGKEFEHDVLAEFFKAIKAYFSDESFVTGLNSLLAAHTQPECFSRAFLGLALEHQAVLLKNLIIIIQNNEPENMDLLCSVISELIALNATEVLKQSNALFEGLIKYLAQQLVNKEDWSVETEPFARLLVKIAQHIQPTFEASEIVKYCSDRLAGADFEQLATLSGEKTIDSLKEYIIIIKVLASVIVGYKTTINFAVLEKLLSIPKIQIASADFTVVLSAFTKHVWKLTYNAIKSKSFSVQETNKLFDKALMGLEINSYQSLYYVYQALYELSFGSNVDRSENLEEMLQSAWASYYDCKRKSHKLTVAFLQLCFNETTLKHDTISDLLDKVLKLSEYSPRLSHLLVAHLCAIFKSDISIASQHIKAVIELCLLPTDSSAEQSDEAKVSSASLLFNVFLSGLDQSNAEVKSFIDRLLTSLLHLNSEPEFSKKEYSTHSKTNKRKLALWRTLSVLTKFIDENLMKEIDAKIWKILAMKNFGNVRYYIQLFIINALYQQQPFIVISLIPQLKQFNQDYTVATSLAVIATYLCLVTLDQVKSQDATEENKKLLVSLLQNIFPWTNHFNHGVRVTCQVAVYKVIQQLKKENDVYSQLFGGQNGVLENREFIDTWFSFMDQNKAMIKLRKSQTKIIDGFNPISAATIEGMFLNNENLDSEVEMLLEETVKKAVRQFQHLVSANEDKISSANATEKSGKNETSGEEQKETIFQKRIIPWEQAVMELDKDNKNPYALKKSRRSLILVGTFLDNTPNVAGLARTAEIFNAKKLVIGNKKLLSEPIFQRISVSAEKHLPIAEVTDRYLPEYLAAKKQKGYTIIGVEQTANSVSLKDYKFPEKCVLILGTEQEGIPPQFLQLVDVAVEIPQFGTIRSLNAHVSASVVIWEYTRQQITK
jgi:tRNA G18 (ribose-2'-O)-methylase SpoU